MTYDITPREVPDQPIVSIREHVAQSAMPAFIGRSFAELYRHLGAQGVAPVGEPFVIYHAFGPDAIDAEVCVSIAGDIATSERIEARVLPATTVAETLHVGPYDALGNAYSALDDWVATHGMETAGPVRERYLNAPGPDVPPEALRTIIQMPIAKSAVVVG